MNGPTLPYTVSRAAIRQSVVQSGDLIQFRDGAGGLAEGQVLADMKPGDMAVLIATSTRPPHPVSVKEIVAITGLSRMRAPAGARPA